ncbi:MAG: transposase [Bacteroidota bacterium]
MNKVRKWIKLAEKNRTKMGKKRRTFSAKQKKEIALAAIRERESMSTIASKYSVHPNQVSQWKKEALLGLEQVFVDKRKHQRELKAQVSLQEELYSEIGRLKMELKWLKKKVGELE